MTSPLDEPMFSCPRCGVELVWQVSHGYHRSECACGWTWCGSTPATARTVLRDALDRYPALRDQVLNAMEGALLRAEEKRYQRAEAERLRARDQVGKDAHPRSPAGLRTRG